MSSKNFACLDSETLLNVAISTITQTDTLPCTNF